MKEGVTFVGTSGYFYDHWRGVFYPEDLPASKFCDYYFSSFRTLELNSTFYHTPKDETLKKWYSFLKAGQLLSIKANRNITHFKKLKNAGTEVEELLMKASILKEKLGVILFQLPPSLKYDLDLLFEFLYRIDTNVFRVAFEFRHRSWLCTELYKALGAKRAAFCISDGRNIPYAEEVTADFAYFRFHGRDVLYASDYSEEELMKYARLMKDLNKRGVACFAYFNNDFGGFAVKNARQLISMLK